MSVKEQIANDYFEWMYDMMCKNRFAEEISYRKLFIYLYSAEFKPLLKMDSNRAADGINLRSRFAYDNNVNYNLVDKVLDEPCSVLEMMVALALRCEETIMDDTRYGNRTAQWFWGMVSNLGLGAYMDLNYDNDKVSYILERFLRREYEANGRGGLFTVRNCNEDLREVEIWKQLMWYLDTIV